jgi:hypothetical protein
MSDSNSGGADDMADDSTVASVRGNELFEKYIPQAKTKGLYPNVVFESSFLAQEDLSLFENWKPHFQRLMQEPQRSAILSIGRQNLKQNIESLTVERAKWENSGASAVSFHSLSHFLFDPKRKRQVQVKSELGRDFVERSGFRLLLVYLFDRID